MVTVRKTKGVKGKQSRAKIQSRLIQQFMDDGLDSVESIENLTIEVRPRFVKGRWRGQQSEKRVSLFGRMPEGLIIDAPIGNYLIDKIALQICKPDESGTDPRSLLRGLRHKVSTAAQAGVLCAKWFATWIPKARRRTKCFLDDIAQIQYLIARNKNLKLVEISFSMEPTSRKYRDEGRCTLSSIDRMRSCLSSADAEIKRYLRANRLAKVGGNRDRFTGFFILELLEVWRHYTKRRAVNGEYEQFKQFVWAAWQDVRLPTEDKDGRNIREWLYDRLRKQFVNGLPKSGAALDALWAKF
jgi:hypothetical protein